MITISVRHNFDAVYRQLERELPQAVQRATLSALNKTIDGSRTQMQRAITSTYKISASLVSERLQVKRASKKGEWAFTATLVGNNASNSKRAMNLIHFAQSKLNRAEKAAWMKQQSLQLRHGGRTLSNPQIPFQIKRSGGRVYVKGAFIGNEGRTVFERKGKARLPIRAVHTIGVSQMFNSTKNTKAVQTWIDQNFPRILKHELAYYVGKARTA